jgi:septal ring factor EnvC (AmiA/AmiB activator)
VNKNDPKYTNYIKKQQNLQDDMIIIADSLKALAKRQMMIQPFVLKELKAIDKGIDESLDAMDKRRKNIATQNQQLSMTSMNNLALLLGESLEQMQQQMMSMQASGQSSCPNPGKPGGSQQMKSMKGLQEQLNQQLQQLREGKKPGSQGKNGQSMSEQLARMAAEQAAIRKKMEEFRDQLKSETGKSDGDVSKMIDDMEKTEKDIVNDRITQETLKRQEEILTRLLKSEKAEQQREEEQRRESEEARDIKVSNPDDFFEYYKIKNREVELLKTLPPNLKPFYKNKVTEYFYRFE